MVAQEKALKSQWKGFCTVTIKRNVTDEETKIEKPSKVTLLVDEPCKLSRKTLQSAGDGEVAEVKTSTKLFISSSVSIPTGSTITVTQNGVTENYSRSGLPGTYTYHQEIPLELIKEYA